MAFDERELARMILRLDADDKLSQPDIAASIRIYAVKLAELILAHPSDSADQDGGTRS